MVGDRLGHPITFDRHELYFPLIAILLDGDDSCAVFFRLDGDFTVTPDAYLVHQLSEVRCNHFVAFGEPLPKANGLQLIQIGGV